MKRNLNVDTRDCSVSFGAQDVEAACQAASHIGRQRLACKQWATRAPTSIIHGGAGASRAFCPVLCDLCNCLCACLRPSTSGVGKAGKQLQRAGSFRCNVSISSPIFNPCPLPAELHLCRAWDRPQVYLEGLALWAVQVYQYIPS